MKCDVKEDVAWERARIQMPCVHAHVGPLQACLLSFLQGLTVCNDQLVFLCKKEGAAMTPHERPISLRPADTAGVSPLSWG